MRSVSHTPGTAQRLYVKKLDLPRGGYYSFPFGDEERETKPASQTSQQSKRSQDSNMGSGASRPSELCVERRRAPDRLRAQKRGTERAARRRAIRMLRAGASRALEAPGGGARSGLALRGARAAREVLDPCAPNPPVRIGTRFNA